MDHIHCKLSLLKLQKLPFSPLNITQQVYTVICSAAIFNRALIKHILLPIDTHGLDTRSNNWQSLHYILLDGIGWIVIISITFYPIVFFKKQELYLVHCILLKFNFKNMFYSVVLFAVKLPLKILSGFVRFVVHTRLIFCRGKI